MGGKKAQPKGGELCLIQDLTEDCTLRDRFSGSSDVLFWRGQDTQEFLLKK